METNIVENGANDQREDHLLANLSLALHGVSSHSESLSTHQVFELKEASSLRAFKAFKVWNVQLKQVALSLDRAFDSAVVEFVEESLILDDPEEAKEDEACDGFLLLLLLLFFNGISISHTCTCPPLKPAQRPVPSRCQLRL